MPDAFYYDVPGNESIYAQVKAEIGNGQPDGLLLHLVVKQGSGLRHINVWESKEQFQRFQQERVLPAIDKVLGEMGIREQPARPEMHEMELVDLTHAH